MRLLDCGRPCVYVLCSCMNVNLSMCKQNVFKHRRALNIKTPQIFSKKKKKNNFTLFLSTIPFKSQTQKRRTECTNLVESSVGFEH